MLVCVWLPPCADAAAEAALARRLFAVSPRVEAAGGGIVFLDVHGVERVHRTQTGRSGPAALFEATRRALDPVRPRGLALAANRFTAEVAARYVRHPVTVSPGEETLFLSRLPLSALPLPDDLARRLHPLGLSTLGDFASLPVAAVERRYGAQGVALHRLARGEDRTPLQPRAEPHRLRVLHEIEGGAESLARLEEPLRAATESLCAALREAGRGATSLVLTLHGPPGASEEPGVPVPGASSERSATDASGGPGVACAPRRWSLAPAAPEDRAGLLVELLRHKLAERPPAGPVETLELELLQSQSLTVHQNHLFGEVARDARRRAEALTRLRALLGEAVLARPQVRRAHRLEQRWRMAPAPPEDGEGPRRPATPARGRAGRGGATRVPAAGATRPGATRREVAATARPGAADADVVSPAPALRVLPRPESLVPVTAGGRTVAFRRGRQTLEVSAVSAPRRLCGGWWDAPYERDEYDLQTADGAVYRIARDRLARRWLLLAEVD